MIVGIIPARGGSKGIPRKNIAPCAGKPLIAWTIERALESKLLEKVFVSTEDNEIAVLSRKYGAQILKRPIDLSEDTTLIVDVLKYHLKKDIPRTKTVVLLQPTSPVREEGLIDFCIETYRNSDADCLATGHDIFLPAYGSTMERRQDMTGYFHDDGNVYCINRNLILNGKLFNNNHIDVYYENEHKEFEQKHEIDTLDDLWLNEQILLKREKEKKENIGGKI